MNPDPDEHTPPGQESLQWGTGIKEKNRGGFWDKFSCMNMDADFGDGGDDEEFDKKPASGYSMLTEQARKMFPGESQCRMFCGGKTCKYCTTEFWKPEQMAVEGLYSEWVTHNIMAMARMSNHNIKKYNMISQFKKLGVKTIINLQEPGEHAFCGFGNDSSGFSYNPQTFMENGIFYYNFALKDYGIASMSKLLDMVKVVQFALSEGKVAIHCHAGLGRTGLLIACYLIYNNRVKAGKCIQYVRSRRARAIQTKQQMNTCHEFQEYLSLFYIIFPNRLPDTPGFSFSQFLSRQRNLLHGYEGRKLKHIPKVIYVCLERLLELCGKGHALSSLRHKQTDPLTEGIMAMDENISLKSEPEDPQNMLSSYDMSTPSTADRGLLCSSQVNDVGKTDISSPLVGDSRHGRLSPLLGRRMGRGHYGDYGDDVDSDVDKDSDESVDGDTEASKDNESILNTLDVEDVCNALTTLEYSTDLTETVTDLEDKLNETDEAWRQLAQEENPLILCAITWDWLDQLNEPILRAQDVSTLIRHSGDFSRALNSLEKSTKHFLEYLACILSKLQPIDPSLLQQVLEIIMCHLTQKRHGDTIYPPSSSLSHMMEEKPDTSFQLFDLFLLMIEREKMRS